MKRLAVWLAAICSLLIATQARAVTTEFVFQGAINQTVFDPFDPFADAIDFGTPFSGKFFFNSTAPDAIPGDPQTGSYTSTGAPNGMTVNIGGIAFTAGDFLNIGVATNFGGVDQYTVLAQRGTPGGLSDFLTLSLFFQGNTGIFANDSLPLTPPDLSKFTLKDFSLDALETVDGTIFQYQFQGDVTQLSVPEPESMWLLGVGLVMLIIRQRLRRIQGDV